MRSIAFIGGDKRNYILSEMMGEYGKVLKFGLDDNNDLFNECINANYIVFPIPFSKDGENLYIPLSNKEINVKECVKDVDCKIVFGGNISDEIKDILEKNDNKVIDIAKDERFIKNNAVPTAEGIIKCIIENTDITINESNILIIGFGNVGEKTAELLKSLNANIYCNDIDKHKVANIDIRGYNSLENLSNYMQKMDVIINTVPKLVLDKNKFAYIKKSTLIIDVASKPGGVDFIHAKKNGYNVIQYLGIPGEVAPRTSAKYMRNIIEKYMI